MAKVSFGTWRRGEKGHTRVRAQMARVLGLNIWACPKSCNMALSSRRASWVLALVPDLGPTSRPLQSSVSETPCAVTGCGRDERREGSRAPVSSHSPCLCLLSFCLHSLGEQSLPRSTHCQCRKPPDEDDPAKVEHPGQMMAVASPPPEPEDLLIVKLEEDSWGSDSRPEESSRSSVPGPEVSRLCFRQFQYRDAAGPHEAFSQLWALCCRWLRPELRLKEQILELLVLEQFLSILPREVQTWVQARHPESGEEAVALVEDWHREAWAAGQQVRLTVCSLRS